MFKITNGRLDPQSLARLEGFQKSIDQESLYANRVGKARTHWDAKRQDRVFGKVVAKLTQMCPTGDYCQYCCVSEAGHIDHFQPISLYPNLTFAWANFLHACERCNTRRKKEQCAVVVGSNPPQLVDVTRPPRAITLCPQRGRIALINPRREDPMQFLSLDIDGTFKFEPKYAPGTAEWIRADYTCDVLGLNRDFLVTARRGAYEAIVRFLVKYHEASVNGNSTDMFRMRRNIREVSHQAVWQELVRSYQKIPEVANVFAACPELVRRHL